MYQEYWKLIRAPFDQRVNPRWFYGSPRHRGSLLHLRRLVERRVPLVLLAGGPGVGKSMVLAVLAHSLASHAFPVVQISNLAVSARDLLVELVQQLERLVSATCCTERECASSNSNDSALIARLRDLLAPWRRTGQHAVLVIDAIDELSECELRKLVRTFRSIGDDRTAPATVVFVGRSDLVARLPRLASLGERLFPQCLLDAMTAPETAGFVSHRLRLAGGNPALFGGRAVELIHDLAAGVPRRINRLSDLALLVARYDEARQVHESHVWTAHQENRILSVTRTATALPAPHLSRLTVAKEPLV